MIHHLPSFYLSSFLTQIKKKDTKTFIVFIQVRSINISGGHGGPGLAPLEIGTELGLVLNTL